MSDQTPISPTPGFTASSFSAPGFPAPNQEELQLAGANNSIDLQPIALALLRNKLLILSCGVLAAFLVWLLMVRTPTTFLAVTEIIPPQIARGSNASALLSQAAASGDTANIGLGSIVGAKSSSESFLIILSAWPLQDGLVQRFNLVKAYHAQDVTQARGILTARTVLKATREGFITIGIIDTDRTRAADMANAYVDQARQFLRGLALSEASQRRAFYEGQLAKTKEDLNEAEVALQHLQQTTGTVSLDAQARMLLDTAASLRAQITSKEVQLESLRSYSTESNPQVQIQESELSALRGQLSQLESHGQGGYSGKSLSSVPGAEVEFIRATREMKYQENLYDLMVKQYEGSRIDEARDAPVIQVIEPALVPVTKYGPRRFRNMRYAFGGGLILGILIVLFRQWKSTIPYEGRVRWGQLRRAAFGR